MSTIVLCAVALTMTARGEAPRIAENGFLQVNGTSFIPFGVFDVNSQEDAYQVRDCGLNVAEGMLPGLYEWASNANLYALHWLIARTKSDEEILSVVRAHLDHPTNLAWFTFDEPNEVGVPASRCEEVYRLIKSRDPFRPVVLVVSPAYWYHPWPYSEYASACDIVATDPYPVEIGHGIGIDYVSECIARARRDSGKPVWAVLQAFPWPGKRLPTARELRCMTYQALVHGASGVLYYTYQVAAWNFHLQDTPLWHTIRDMSAELQVLSPVLTSPTIRSWEVSTIHLLEGQHNGSTHFIGVNAGPEAQTLCLPVDKSIRSAEVLFEDRSVRAIDGIIEEVFDPHDVHVYRVTESPGLPPQAGLLLGLGLALMRRRPGTRPGI